MKENLFKKICFIGAAFLCACSNLYIPEDFVYQEIETDGFRLASWQKMTSSTDAVKIYIEGDGAAFNAHGQPTGNPTPKGKFIRQLAFGDYQPNVVYLARPCQFVKDNKCVQKYWTTARFAKEVVEAEYQAIKQIAKEREVILIGFSGGAQVAGLIAVLYPDVKVKKLITIAGNLNHRAWTTHHSVPELRDSMDLADYRMQYLQFHQMHFVGQKDEVMPPFLIEDFVGLKNVIEVPEARHGSQWESIYAQIWAEN